MTARRVTVRRVATWGAMWLAVVAVLMVLKLAGVEVIDLFKDPIELRQEKLALPWKGTVGTLGALGWIAGAAVCLCAASTLRPSDGRRNYLAATGLVLLALGLDDALVIHDHLVPYFTGFDKSEKLVLGLLAGLVVAWAIRFRRRLQASDVLLLAMSGAGLGAAFGIDALQSLGLDAPGIGLIEEVSELLGLITLVCWAVFESRRAVLEPEICTASTADQADC